MVMMIETITEFMQQPLWGGNVQGIIVASILIIPSIVFLIMYFLRDDEISDEDFLAIALEEMDNPDFK